MATWTSLGLLFFYCSVQTTIVADKVWSPWYNSSPGQALFVEDETLERLAMTFDMPCSTTQVLDVECREIGSNETFSELQQYNNNVLHVPCNITGLLCRNEDQVMAGSSMCADYEVRVLCEVQSEPNNTPAGPAINDEDDFNDLSANGGFIAMAAGGSVVLPLVCVLIMQLRKSKREEQRRQQQARQAAEDMARAEEAARAVDAPPAYEELFGSRSGSVSVISNGSLSLDGSTVVSEVDEQRRGSTERLVNNSPSAADRQGHGDGRTNHGASSELTSSSSSSLSSSASSASSSVVTTSTSSSLSSAVSDLRVHSSPTTSSSHDTNIRRASSASSSTMSTSSSDALLPSTSSRSDALHNDPPPAYDWPGQITVVVQTGDRRRTSSVPPPQSPAQNIVTAQPVSSGEGSPRRFLGMHLSIFDLMTAIYPDPTPTPPPSYDDALKILGVPSRPEVQVT